MKNLNLVIHEEFELGNNLSVLEIVEENNVCSAVSWSGNVQGVFWEHEDA